MIGGMARRVSSPVLVGRDRELDDEGGRGLVGVHLPRRPAQLAHPQPAGTQHRWRGAAPERDEQVEPAQHLECGTACRAVDHVRAAAHRPDVRRLDGHFAHKSDPAMFTRIIRDSVGVS